MKQKFKNVAEEFKTINKTIRGLNIRKDELKRSLSNEKYTVIDVGFDGITIRDKETGITAKADGAEKQTRDNYDEEYGNFTPFGMPKAESNIRDFLSIEQSQIMKK